MKKARRYTVIGYTVVLAMVMSHCQLALAGWTGAMNGSGYGMASVNVKAFDDEEGKRRTSVTPNMQDPSVAMTLTFGYFSGAFLPLDASRATQAKVKGFAGYIWDANVVGSDGDDTGNSELEGRITITAADCATLKMNSSSVINENDKTGTLIVNCIGTSGTAVWLRGFELTGGQVPPEDDTNTLSNEFVEFLKDNGTLKWDVLYVGPLDLTTTNCNAINIPFTYETSITNLYAVSDGVAKSLPLVIQCPTDIVVACGQPFTYPETVIVGGCGNITVSFNPSPLTNASGTILPFTAGSFPFPLGTNLVTITATDKDTNTTSCTFNVIVGGQTLKGFHPPVGTQSNLCETTTVTANKGNIIPIKFDLLCGTSSVTTGISPIVKIEEFDPNCQPTGKTVSSPAVYQNDWHANWDTNPTTKAYKYKISVTLNGTVLGYVWIKVK